MIAPTGWFAGMAVRPLHAARRRWTQFRLRNSKPSTVLFVCRGNLCRSPYAAAAFVNAISPTDMRVESGGFLSFTTGVPPLAGLVAKQRGVDLSAHRSTSLTRAQVLRSTLIIVMEPKQARLLRLCFGDIPARVVVLGDLDPAPSAQRSIRDPMDQGEPVFQQSFARIDRCVEELARVLTGRK